MAGIVFFCKESGEGVDVLISRLGDPKVGVVKGKKLDDVLSADALVLPVDEYGRTIRYVGERFGNEVVERLAGATKVFGTKQPRGPVLRRGRSFVVRTDDSSIRYLVFYCVDVDSFDPWMVRRGSFVKGLSSAIAVADRNKKIQSVVVDLTCLRNDKMGEDVWSALALRKQYRSKSPWTFIAQEGRDLREDSPSPCSSTK